MMIYTHVTALTSTMILDNTYQCRVSVACLLGKKLPSYEPQPDMNVSLTSTKVTIYLFQHSIFVIN